MTFYKKVDGVIVNQCSICQLASTNNISSKNTQAKNGSTYSLNDYLTIKKIQQSKFQMISKIINKVISRGNILEVGAGHGLFASVLSRNKNYKIEVVEPGSSLYFVKSNQKIIKYKTSYEKFVMRNKKKYKAIIFLDVLEHFTKPDYIINKTKEIIEDNGYLVLQFPNYRSLMAKICKNWSWWLVDHHKFHFSPRSIKLMLKKNGFKVIYLKTYESFYDFKKNLDGNFINIRNNLLRQIIKGFYLSLFFPIYVLFKKIIWKFGYGGLILVIAKN